MGAKSRSEAVPNTTHTVGRAINVQRIFRLCGPLPTCSACAGLCRILELIIGAASIDHFMRGATGGSEEG